MRILASAVRDFSTIRLYWVRPKEARIPTMITTIISSTKVKPCCFSGRILLKVRDLNGDCGRRLKLLVNYTFILSKVAREIICFLKAVKCLVFHFFVFIISLFPVSGLSRNFCTQFFARMNEILNLIMSPIQKFAVGAS